MSEDRSESKTKTWKKKAKARQQENAKLRKRNKELIQSRDNWKSKYQLLKSGKLPMQGIGKARGHHYPLFIVVLCMQLCRYAGMSLRSCAHCIRCMPRYPGQVVPSHVSIRNWLLKVGHYRLQAAQAAKEKAGKWALIVDESVTIGTERLLVVLGLEIGSWQFKRSPALEDVHVLHLEVRKEWKGDAVGKVLERVMQGCEVVQGTSDAGRNLLSAFEMCGVLHMPDCSHAIAAILERHLGREEQFKALNVLCGQLRQYWATSTYAGWMPPKHRGKSRFMNVFPVVKWVEKIFAKQAVLPPAVREKTDWLFQNREFMEELIRLRKTVSLILSVLKKQGACIKSVEAAEGFLSKIGETKCEWLQAVVQNISGYLQVLRSKMEGNETTFLCCSDIIESLFGKFKYALNPANPSQITERALIIPYFCGSINDQQVKLALENVSNDQVKNWKETNLTIENST